MESGNPWSVLDGECITDAACVAIEGHIATSAGLCQACADSSMISSVDKSQCITQSACQNEGGNPWSVLGSECITDEACIAIEGHVATSAGLCQNCVPTGDQVNEDRDACVSGTDSDSDGVADLHDVDDDDDGLIEIRTAEELYNIRFNLAGTSYDDEEDDDTGNEGSRLGAPESPTANCPIATDGVYLCGYELVADIDFSGPDGLPGTTGDNIDLNGPATIGNLDPMGSDQAGQRFRAILEGNGNAISNIDIDITHRTAANDHSNDAGLFASCVSTSTGGSIGQAAEIRNLILESPRVKGRRYVGALCGGTPGANAGIKIIGVHVTGSGSIQGDSASTFSLSIGGLVGYMNAGAGTDQIIGSSNGVGISNGGTVSDYMGGLVGWMSSGSLILRSSSSANIITGNGGNDHMGGLVGYSQGSIIGSRSSGVVGDGRAGSDYIGGLVGSSVEGMIVGSSSSGSVALGGDGIDHMGGLVGQLTHAVVSESFSSASVCDGSDNTCGTAGMGDDNVGALIGTIFGEETANTNTALRSQVHNSMAVGTTVGHGSDNVGFIGLIRNGNQTKLDANITNNHFDTTTATVNKAGDAPDGVTISTLAGITGSATAVLKTATAYTSWRTTRWLFVDNAYPLLLYFNFDPDNPETENPNPSLGATIKVCETISSNDQDMDEGEASIPDCGDILSAWPRP